MTTGKKARVGMCGLGSFSYVIGNTVQRSSNNQSAWTTVCDACVSDSVLPWRDASGVGEHLWYRVAAANTDGILGAFSDPVRSS